jgi:hypothetical protein
MVTGQRRPTECVMTIHTSVEAASRGFMDQYLHYGSAEMASRVAVWGSTAECLAKLGELVQAGAQHLLLNPVFDEREHLELLAEDIVPHL